MSLMNPGTSSNSPAASSSTPSSASVWGSCPRSSWRRSRPHTPTPCRLTTHPPMKETAMRARIVRATPIWPATSTITHSSTRGSRRTKPSSQAIGESYRRHRLLRPVADARRHARVRSGTGPSGMSSSRRCARRRSTPWPGRWPTPACRTHCSSTSPAVPSPAEIRPGPGQRPRPYGVRCSARSSTPPACCCTPTSAGPRSPPASRLRTRTSSSTWPPAGAAPGAGTPAPSWPPPAAPRRPSWSTTVPPPSCCRWPHSPAVGAWWCRGASWSRSAAASGCPR